jgi:hypothetical protein
VILPQIDARLWTHYHTTPWLNHLTRTINVLTLTKATTE